jgi:hypothetical protein
MPNAAPSEQAQALAPDSQYFTDVVLGPKEWPWPSFALTLR